MEIKDNGGLLKKSADEQISKLLEELDIDATEDKAAEVVEPEDVKDAVADKQEDDSVSAEEVAPAEIKEELKVDATEKKDPEELEPALDKDDVYGDEEVAAEDVKPVVVESEDVTVDAVEAKDPDRLDVDTTTKVVEDKMDEDHKGAEDVKPVVVESKDTDDAKALEADDPTVAKAKEDSEGDDLEPAESKVDDTESELDDEDITDTDLEESALFKLIRSINESVCDTCATEDREPEELELELSNDDVYSEDEEVAAEDVKPVVVESEDVTVDAVEAKDPDKLDVDTTTKAVEDKMAEDHEGAEDVKPVVIAEGATTEEIVSIVIEAAKLCKESGKPATIANICEAADEKLSALKVPADKDYAVTDDEEAARHGDREKVEAECEVKPEDIHVNESVKYSSLKEACMLDEGYFTTDSYIKETADEKVARLTEQVALLMAREANDPGYDELLKESVYCARLQESLKRKYRDAAKVKASKICGK